jgi:hypothetical protein
MIRFLIPAARPSWYLFMFMLIHLYLDALLVWMRSLGRKVRPRKAGRLARSRAGERASRSGAGAGETLRMAGQFVMAGLVAAAMPRAVLRSPALVGV